MQIKAYREYERERKPIGQLTEEDQYMLHLSKVDRLSTKLQIMSFIANFFDNVHTITPVGFTARHPWCLVPSEG